MKASILKLSWLQPCFVRKCPALTDVFEARPRRHHRHALLTALDRSPPSAHPQLALNYFPLVQRPSSNCGVSEGSIKSFKITTNRQIVALLVS
ncbi:hypothetical protein O181_093362 [Austropuccinia psidii MF-1]|uniref:Uncharacterized protein n=1 Tax=Austropuccinia psidii MF-1 TaxID=1389203 RepID=A0A9Q3J0W5_9BASI|nr:hypothetical protein [Austropuccinia psidii MF-1]